jgi:hypothetical protein
MENKQIVFIHGGSSFSKYDDFLQYLQTKDIDDPLDQIVVKKWRMTLREVLPTDAQ